MRKFTFYSLTGGREAVPTGEEVITVFVYGSASAGPPRDVVAFVEGMQRLTQPWYDAQRAVEQER